MSGRESKLLISRGKRFRKGFVCLFVELVHVNLLKNEILRLVESRVHGDVKDDLELLGRDGDFVFIIELEVVVFALDLETQESLVDDDCLVEGIDSQELPFVIIVEVRFLQHLDHLIILLDLDPHFVIRVEALPSDFIVGDVVGEFVGGNKGLQLDQHVHVSEEDDVDHNDIILVERSPADFRDVLRVYVQGNQRGFF